MNRRRALLSGGKKPLYIYQPGFTAFQNATYNEYTVKSGTFRTDYFEAVSGTSSTTSKVALYVDFTGYNKLVFEVRSSSSNNNTKVGWQNTGSEPIKNEVTGGTISTTRTKYELDISAAEGQKIFTMQIYKGHTLYLYDLHLE